MARPAPTYAPITRHQFDHARGVGRRDREQAYAWIKAAEADGYRWISIEHAIHAWQVHQTAQALAR